MLKIKVIDLLNKIADGEKPPIHIKCSGLNLYWNDEHSTYDVKKKCLYVRFYRFDYSELNNEVEIIEEDKKIEKLNDKIGHFGSNNTKKIINELNYTRTTINQLIDEINKLKEDKC